MKLLLALLAVAGLSGCVYGGGPYYGSAGVYYSDPPYYGYGPYYGAPYVLDQRPIIVNRHHHYRGGSRDQDRDGVPNRADRDRDGDGVPNRRDAFPRDPGRR